MLYDHCVIGGGVVGMAAAMALLEGPGSSVLVLDKEADPRAAPVRHGSAVVHSGIQPSSGRPGRATGRAASTRATFGTSPRSRGSGDLLPYEAGIRAQAVLRNGTMVHDFLLEETPRSLHLLNAPSPAATSAIPIGEMIADRALATG